MILFLQLGDADVHRVQLLEQKRAPTRSRRQALHEVCLAIAVAGLSEKTFPFLTHAEVGALRILRQAYFNLSRNKEYERYPELFDVANAMTSWAMRSKFAKEET